MAVGCAVGLLLAGKLGHRHRRQRGDLLGIGALCRTPLIVALVTNAIVGPDRNGANAAGSIRSGLIPISRRRGKLVAQVYRIAESWRTSPLGFVAKKPCVEDYPINGRRVLAARSSFQESPLSV